MKSTILLALLFDSLLIFMAETTVPLDTVIQHLSDTVSQHDSLIRKLEESIESVRSQIDTRTNTVRENTKQELQSLEANLTNLITSKDTVGTQVTDNIHSRNTGLQELKNLFTNHTVAPSPSLHHPAPTNVSTTVHTPACTAPPPIVNIPGG